MTKDDVEGGGGGQNGAILMCQLFCAGIEKLTFLFFAKIKYKSVIIPTQIF